MHKLWEWAKEVLNPKELSSMFLAKDRYERTAWPITLDEGQTELLHKLWEWAKKLLTLEDVKNMFLAKLDMKVPPGTKNQKKAK